MEKYVLVESFGRSNIQNRLWYVMSINDIWSINAQFGDRAYVITEGTTFYMGNNNSWYDETGQEFSAT